MNRPKLTAVFKGKGEAEAQSPTSPPTSPDRAQMVQLNVKVSEELRRAARVKALQEGRDLAEVVRELLREWVES